MSKQNIALEAEAISASKVQADGDKLIVMKGSLSEIFTKALNVVFAKPNALNGEYVAMESQAIDAVMLKRSQAMAATTPANQNLGVQINAGGPEAGSTYTVYGVSKMGITPEDIVAVKTDLESMTPEERDRYFLVVNACEPSSNSPDATGRPVEYFQSLQTALESVVESYGGHSTDSMDEAMEAILEDDSESIYKNLAMEGFFDTVRQIFSKKNTLTKKELGWMSKMEESVIKKVKTTFANPAWVKSNIKPAGQIALNPKVAAGLVVNGKIASPLEAVKDRGDMYVRNYDANIGAVKKFEQDSEMALKQISAFFQKNKNAKAVETFAEQVIAKIHVPDAKKVINDVSQRRKAAQAALQKAPKSVPTLTAEQVVETANEVLKYLYISSYKGGKPEHTVIGSDFQEDFFQDIEGYEGEILRTGDVGDFFYEQGTAVTDANFAAGGYATLLNEALYSALAILANSTKTENDLTEGAVAMEGFKDSIKKIYNKMKEAGSRELTTEEQMILAVLTANQTLFNNHAKVQEAATTHMRMNG